MNKENDYFKNLEKIEKCWRDLRKMDFPQNLRDNLWRLCMKGQILFWQIDRTGIKTVPAFKRAIMLLEYEKRYKDAIKMCNEANKWKINTDWYSKRIDKLSGKI